MESNTFTLFLEPILDPQTQEYLNVITLSCIPRGDLAANIQRISLPKLSPFENNSNRTNCTIVLRRNNFTWSSFSHKYMVADDIPEVLEYLCSHGYTIRQDFTNIMRKSQIPFSKSRRMICIVSYL